MTATAAAPAILGLRLWMEWLALVAFALVMLWIGRLVFARTERRMRMQGTLGQH
jgi:membrane protein implicated in regulation of membrane protease activity